MQAANGSFIHPRINTTLYRLVGFAVEAYSAREYTKREAARARRENGRTVESWLFIECWL